jgi:hypothetical protein
MTQTLYAHMNKIKINKETNKQKTQRNKKRKCGIYTQWNFIQPQRRMKFCHLQVNGWNWRTSP